MKRWINISRLIRVGFIFVLVLSLVTLPVNIVLAADPPDPGSNSGPPEPDEPEPDEPEPDDPEPD